MGRNTHMLELSQLYNFIYAMHTCLMVQAHS